MKKVKLPPVRSSGWSVRADARYSGALSDCIARNHPANAADFERRWHRAQMRGWAGHWRESRVEAAMLGKPVEAVATLNLSLAVVYRDAARRPAPRAVAA